MACDLAHVRRVALHPSAEPLVNEGIVAGLRRPDRIRPDAVAVAQIAEPVDRKAIRSAELYRARHYLAWRHDLLLSTSNPDILRARPSAGQYNPPERGDTVAEAVPVLEALAHRRADQDILIIVGPEGGFAEAERAALQAGGLSRCAWGSRHSESKLRPSHSWRR